MNWIKLNGKKEPPFNEKMIISFPTKDGTDTDFAEVYLTKIEVSLEGKWYLFSRGEDQYDSATHYCIPTEPKK